MADLVTHLCSGIIAKAATGRPHVAVFLVGTVAPDLFSRVPSMLLIQAKLRGFSIPDAMIHSFEPLHLPAGMVLLSLCLSMFFRSSERLAVWLNLMGGMLLHLVVDMLQDHHGIGYVIGFPFFEGSLEVGVVSSEASVRWVPVLLLVSFGVTLWRRKKTRLPMESDGNV